MFKKVLVANRGEIAVRILRACEERGQRTVTVFSEADRDALHVRYADEAYCIGPPPASESYLNIERLIEVAQESRATAIHPGYGFLAENPAFARACTEAGIAFVGPTPEAMAAMGDKVKARRRMEEAGVPVIPGSDGFLEDGKGIEASAKEIGYPLLVKATAGGGGRGMRVVRFPEELMAAVDSARREAQSAFGDDRIYLEKLIEGGRHIEIQILADTRGNIIHLGERECSIQRRHQKLIEESPSYVVDEELRQQMGEVAVRAARAVGYVNAGTVEYLLDRDRQFYFMEMNTRLQVEHPTTEMVTGVDIVKEQLSIAVGRRLRYRQKDIRQDGWSIECRIMAEDPYNDFLPSSGCITSLFEPTGPGVRVESGVYEGFEVSPYYDSLIAKLIVWGETRPEAILRMRRALREFRIGGIKTTIPFHQHVMDSTTFQGGRFDVNYLEQRFTFAPNERVHKEYRRVAAIAASLVAHQHGREVWTLGAEGQSQVSEDSPWKRAGRLMATGQSAK